jgi:hypothetical protein
MKMVTLPEYEATMCGLSKWYKAKMEKLGLMVLAKEKGYDSTINEYKKGIARLLKSIEHVMGQYQDPDRRHDLAVMYMSTQCLQSFVMKTM